MPVIMFKGAEQSGIKRTASRPFDPDADVEVVLCVRGTVVR